MTVGVVEEALSDDKGVFDFKEEEREKGEADAKEVGKEVFFVFQLKEEIERGGNNDKERGRVEVNDDADKET